MNLQFREICSTTCVMIFLFLILNNVEGIINRLKKTTEELWHGYFITFKKIEIMKNNSSKRKSDTKSGSQQRNKQMSQKGKGSKSRSMSNGSGNRSNGK